MVGLILFYNLPSLDRAFPYLSPSVRNAFCPAYIRPQRNPYKSAEELDLYLEFLFITILHYLGEVYLITVSQIVTK